VVDPQRGAVHVRRELVAQEVDLLGEQPDIRVRDEGRRDEIECPAVQVLGVDVEDAAEGTLAPRTVNTFRLLVSGSVPSGFSGRV